MVIAAYSPDIVMIAESWGNDSTLDSELAISGFDIFRADRRGAVGEDVSKSHQRTSAIFHKWNRFIRVH